MMTLTLSIAAVLLTPRHSHAGLDHDSRIHQALEPLLCKTVVTEHPAVQPLHSCRWILQLRLRRWPVV
jgi:hypothetical protein